MKEEAIQRKPSAGNAHVRFDAVDVTSAAAPGRVSPLCKRMAAVLSTVFMAAVSWAVEFPNPAEFNPTWESAKPGASYSADLPTAARLGNGSLGSVNGGDGNHKKFVLTRGRTRNSGEATIERDFNPGEVVVINH